MQRTRNRPWTLGLACLAIAATAARARADEPAEAFPEHWYFDVRDVAMVRRLEGRPAKEISAVEWVGEPRSLHALRGKVVVLDFWAAWCPPCIRALALDIDLVKRMEQKDVVVVGIHDGTIPGRAHWANAKRWASERGVNFSFGLDHPENDKSHAVRYGVAAFPTYVVIDRAGVVRAAGIVPERVEDVVRVLLEEPVSGPAAEFPPEYFLGGESCPRPLRDLEGGPAPGLASADWLGGAMPVKPGQLAVVQYFSPDNRASMLALEALRKAGPELTSKGAVVVALASATADPERIKAVAGNELKDIAVGRELKPEAPADVPGAGGPRAAVTPYVPTMLFPTVLVDGRGVVRAAGLRADAVLAAVEHVAAHEAPTPAPPRPAAPRSK